MTQALLDLRHGVRMLRKSPGFSLIALLTLSIGIGATTSIFSFVDAWILTPLPYKNADRLVFMQTVDANSGWRRTVPVPDFLDWRARSQTLQNLAAWSFGSFNLTGVGEPERLKATMVTTDFLPMLGVEPALGRTFLSEEGVVGKDHVVLITDALWKARFNSDPGVLNKTITLDGATYQVIGVLPEKFHFPLAGRVDVWAPFAFTDAQKADRTSRWLQLVGSMKPGTSVGQVRGEMKQIAGALAKEHPDTNGARSAYVNSLFDEIGRHQGNQPVLVVFGIVACVLLIACSNVANLMLARSTVRRKEMAVRLAMGAGRARLVRQIVVENLTLFAAAGVVGIGIANWLKDWMVSLIPYENRGYLRNYGQIEIDFGAFVFIALVSLGSGVLFGLIPALNASRVDVHEALKEASGKGAGSQRARRTQSILVTAELAIAVMLLVGAGLMIKSFGRMYMIDPGFKPQGVLTARVELSETAYKGPVEIRSFADRLVQRIAALPGVTAAGAGRFVPFGQENANTEFVIDGRPVPAKNETPSARFNAITPGYADTMQLKVMSGRLVGIQDDENAPNVVVVNETLARRHWPNANPVGQSVRLGREAKVVRQVIGVVRDIKAGQLSDPAEAQIYVPFAQMPSRAFSVALRASSDPSGFASTLRREVWAIDRNQPVARVLPMEQLINEEHAPFKIVTGLVAAFGGLALFLSAIGLYGVIAYQVAQRTREIGIRIALGATRFEVARLVVRDGLKLVVFGLVPGMFGAWGLGQMLSNALFDVVALDPTVFTVMPLALCVVALLASVAPARGAMRMDPIRALRYE